MPQHGIMPPAPSGFTRPSSNGGPAAPTLSASGSCPPLCTSAAGFGEKPRAFAVVLRVDSSQSPSGGEASPPVEAVPSMRIVGHDSSSDSSERVHRVEISSGPFPRGLVSRGSAPPLAASRAASADGNIIAATHRRSGEKLLQTVVHHPEQTQRYYQQAAPTQQSMGPHHVDVQVVSQPQVDEKMQIGYLPPSASPRRGVSGSGQEYVMSVDGTTRTWSTPLPADRVATLHDPRVVAETIRGATSSPLPADRVTTGTTSPSLLGTDPSILLPPPTIVLLPPPTAASEPLPAVPPPTGPLAPGAVIVFDDPPAPPGPTTSDEVVVDHPLPPSQLHIASSPLDHVDAVTPDPEWEPEPSVQSAEPSVWSSPPPPAIASTASAPPSVNPAASLAGVNSGYLLRASVRTSSPPSTNPPPRQESSTAAASAPRSRIIPGSSPAPVMIPGSMRIMAASEPRPLPVDLGLQVLAVRVRSYTLRGGDGGTGTAPRDRNIALPETASLAEAEGLLREAESRSNAKKARARAREGAAADLHRRIQAGEVVVEEDGEDALVPPYHVLIPRNAAGRRVLGRTSLRISSLPRLADYGGKVAMLPGKAPVLEDIAVFPITVQDCSGDCSGSSEVGGVRPVLVTLPDPADGNDELRVFVPAVKASTTDPTGLVRDDLKSHVREELRRGGYVGYDFELLEVRPEPDLPLLHVVGHAVPKARLRPPPPASWWDEDTLDELDRATVSLHFHSSNPESAEPLQNTTTAGERDETTNKTNGLATYTSGVARGNSWHLLSIADAAAPRGGLSATLRQVAEQAGLDLSTMDVRVRDLPEDRANNKREPVDDWSLSELLFYWKLGPLGGGRVHSNCISTNIGRGSAHSANTTPPGAEMDLRRTVGAADHSVVDHDSPVLVQQDEVLLTEQAESEEQCEADQSPNEGEPEAEPFLNRLLLSSFGQSSSEHSSFCLSSSSNIALLDCGGGLPSSCSEDEHIALHIDLSVARIAANRAGTPSAEAAGRVGGAPHDRSSPRQARIVVMHMGDRRTITAVHPRTSAQKFVKQLFPEEVRSHLCGTDKHFILWERNSLKGWPVSCRWELSTSCWEDEMATSWNWGGLQRVGGS